ncbi:hypothetical protein RRG08_020088 [Elysia crispata]|uniref:Uncharacterized protein n=1 Tax=Elysia crispata TaxID=231223 RepID=A0AAE1A542_9GAST|nr:hypothetical protein RRG08_020088 [Elysia crispata]
MSREQRLVGGAALTVANCRSVPLALCLGMVLNIVLEETRKTRGARLRASREDEAIAALARRQTPSVSGRRSDRCSSEAPDYTHSFLCALAALARHQTPSVSGRRSDRCSSETPDSERLGKTKRSLL